MVCIHCGTNVDSGSNFCWKCGEKLNKYCNCWVMNALYDCGRDKCPGQDLIKKRGAQFAHETGEAAE